MTALIETQAAPTPLAILAAAVEKGVDADQLEKLMALQERYERNRAAERFGEAVSAFQAECPAVVKRRQTTQTDRFEGYSYASYDDVMRAAGPVLAKHGIAVSFSTEQADASLKVTCRIRVGIHFEDHTFTTPIPSMKVIDTQKYGAALSYAKRYTLCAALNIVVTGEDDDASRLMDCIGPKEIAELNTLIEQKAVDLDRFLKWVSTAAGVEVESLDKMPAGVFAKAVDMLRRKKGGAA